MTYEELEAQCAAQRVTIQRLHGLLRGLERPEDEPETSWLARLRGMAEDHKKICEATRPVGDAGMALLSEMRELRDVLGTDLPWPMVDVLARLVASARHLLGDHACDAHGYEGLDAAIVAAVNLLDRARLAMAARAR
jgi:hypothetical protein